MNTLAGDWDWDEDDEEEEEDRGEGRRQAHEGSGDDRYIDLSDLSVAPKAQQVDSSDEDETMSDGFEDLL